ncbi:MAG: ferredoxin III, nif-specific [Magnetococcales bacterium]|nr:ferredoxin III, nif-specific [Magnetococcales bacterium]MBF0271821.1 ferredoxin III, nif-specific [Magnetococcales bacterium]
MTGTFVTSLTRGGTPWMPTFITLLDGKRCIGCGRCFKVCPREVFDLVDRDSVAGLSGSEEEEDWQDDGFDDDPHMVMIIHNADDCIGCAACSKVCPKRCHTHAPLSRNG